MTFIASLTPYDYIGFAIVILVFVLLLTLGLMLKKQQGIAVVLILLSFVFLFGGPFAVHALVYEYLYKNSPTVNETRTLYYSDSLIIKGTLSYTGKRNASRCKITAQVHKVSESFLQNLAHKLKPFHKKSTTVEDSFIRGTIKEYKIVVEPFNYEGDYNVTVKGRCYL